MFKVFKRNTNGVTLLEYAMIVALVGIAAVTILSTLGGSISKEFSKVNAAMAPVKSSVISK